MEKFYINPKFKNLSRELHLIPQHNYRVDKVFCNHRNTVELVRMAGEYFVVKRYKRPTLANCLIYTWFRKPKTRRAYDNALMLTNLGVETAEPVAYIEKTKNGFFHTGWFISRYLPCVDVKQYYDNIEDPAERQEFAKAFIGFTNSLFEKHLLDEDYNTGNILTYKKDGTYHFALVDINRIKVCKPTKFEEVRALRQLRLGQEKEYEVLALFARTSHCSLSKLKFLYQADDKANALRHDLKHWLKRRIATPRQGVLLPTSEVCIS